MKTIKEITANVELDPTIPGQCQMTTHLDTVSSEASKLATGTMFSVTAKESIEILSFEFAYFATSSDSDDDLVVEIYTREGNDYLSVRETPEEWTLVTDYRTIGVESPDEKDDNIMIVPRVDMYSSALTVNVGKSRSFYLTLKSQNLRLKQQPGGSTGKEYIKDNILGTNVGIGVRLADFGTEIEKNQAFQGRIHYRKISDCNKYMDSSQIVFPFVIDSTFAPQDPTAAFQSALKKLFDGEKAWTQWTENHNLELASLEVVSKEKNKDDCSQYGIENNCILYDSTLFFTHFQSLTSKEIELELLGSLEKRNDTIGLDDDITIFYIGDQILEHYYEIDLRGVKRETTFLNPLQRDYIGEVTFHFLDEYAEVEPYKVEFVGQLFASDKKRHLRGRRKLQEPGQIRVGVNIFGVGSDESEFFAAIEEAFQDNDGNYKNQLQRAHTRPGQINEIGDFGSIYKDLVSVSVISNKTTVETDDSSFFLYDNQFWVYVCSATLSMSFLFLVYRIYSDCCCCVKNASEITKETLTDSHQESSTQPSFQKEADYSKRSTETQETVQSEASSRAPMRRLKANKSRGSSKKRSSSSIGQGTQTKNHKESQGVKTTKSRRGVRATKSFGDAPSSGKTVSRSKRFSPHRGNDAAKRRSSTGIRSISPKTTNNFEPSRRGVSASKSFDHAEKIRRRSGKKSVPTKNNSVPLKSNKREPQRGITASKSLDGSKTGYYIGGNSSRKPTRRGPVPSKSSSSGQKPANVKGYLGERRSSSKQRSNPSYC